MIRKVTDNDFDFIYELFMHPQSNPFLLYELMDKTSFAPIFKDLLLKEVLFIYEKESIPIGMCKLVPQHHRNAHIVYLGSVAILPNLTGKGEGLQLLEEIRLYVKERGFLRIELTVATGNEKAIRLYEKAGFMKEGILKKYTLLKTENRFIDEIVMAYLF